MKLNVELIKIPFSYLEEQFDGDIYNYFDVEWGSSCSWMEYKGNTGLLKNMYIVLDASDCKAYIVEFFTDKKDK